MRLEGRRKKKIEAERETCDDKKGAQETIEISSEDEY
jgi:hypothetical protein